MEKKMANYIEKITMEFLWWLLYAISAQASVMVLLKAVRRRNGVGRNPPPPNGVLGYRWVRKIVGTSATVEGCDDGVVCLSGFPTAGATAAAIHLWNPSRNDLHKLPPPPSGVGDRGWRNIGFRLGLGRDPSTGDLKVVRICSPTYDHPSTPYLFNLFIEGTQVWVYSKRANSWRGVEGWGPLVDPTSPDDIIQFTSFDRECSVVVDACLHWGMHYKLSGPGLTQWVSKFGIVAFDLSMETFRIINPPPEMTQVVVRDGLAKLFGCLALVVRDPGHRHDSVEIWAMKQYGVSSSWTKHAVFSLTTAFDFTSLLQPKCVSKIQLTDGGRAVISTARGTILYDLHSQTVLQFHSPPISEAGFLTQDIPLQLRHPYFCDFLH